MTRQSFAAQMTFESLEDEFDILLEPAFRPSFTRSRHDEATTVIHLPATFLDANAQLRVEFATDYEFVLEHANNIREGGLFARTRLRPRIGEVLRVEIVLPDGVSLHTDARVARRIDVPEPGVGLELLPDERFEAGVFRYMKSLLDR